MALTPPFGARMIAFDDAPRHMRGVTPRPFVPSFPAKDPSEDLNYGLDFRRVIEGSQAIVQVDVSIEPASAVVVAGMSSYGSIVTLRLLGGVGCVSAKLSVICTLSDGQRVSRAVLLPIVARGPSPVTEPDAVTVNGLPLSVGRQPITADADPPITVDDDPISIGGQPLVQGV